MSTQSSETPSRFIQISKWGGCFTALVFAVGGLLFDIAWSGGVYDTLSRGSWIIVAISTAVGLTGVVLDRSHRLPESSDSTLHDGS